MSSLTFDIEQLYAKTFGSKPYKVGRENSLPAPAPHKVDGSNDAVLFDAVGNTLREYVNGTEIWLPTEFANIPASVIANTSLSLPYSVISIRGSSTIIRTPLNERKGTVKEFFSIDDYKITLKGFFIDIQNRVWPYDDINALKQVHEMGIAFSLDNALSNVFLSADDRVVITDFELLPVEGGRKHVRPFVIQLESDSVFELEYNV
jgi:hypothetical protein